MNVAWTRAAEGMPRRAFTADDLRRMIDAGIISEDERIELIEGEFVVMAAKGYAHEFVRLALVELLSDARPKGIRVASEPAVQFADNSVVEPDIAVFARSSMMRSGAGFVRLAEGSSLLIVEVAVKSLRADKTRKEARSGRQGVRE